MACYSANVSTFSTTLLTSAKLEEFATAMSSSKEKSIHF